MIIRKLLIAIALLSSTAVIADSHTDAALAHVKATDLQTTFSLTRGNVLERLDQYKQQLLAAPAVSGNPEAIKLTQDFIVSAKKVAEDIYVWKNVEEKYLDALKETYSEEELLQINSWLASKYGKVFISKQKKFMLKTIDIGNYAGQLFQQRIAPIEKEFTANVAKLSQ
jgi:hypothetical protein